MLHAVVMAGGSGTRFWPESRADRPKQLLRLVGQRTMIQATVDRLAGAIPPERVLIVTNVRQAAAIAAQLPELRPEAILAEPCKRDTAPCIGLAAIQVSILDPDATMIVMPADHVIRPDETFRQAIRYAASLVEREPKRIVTFGVKPTYPAETFGYIERGQPLPSGEPLPSGNEWKSTPPTYRVKQFREKPSAEVAREYLASGNFYWNSGIFVWKANTILAALARYQPEMHAHLFRIADALASSDFQAVLEREFAAIQPISIDYAVMEPATQNRNQQLKVVVIEAPFEWDDVGSWQAIARLHGADAEGNTISAKHLGLNTKGTIVRGPDDHLIVTLGLADCIVVHTPDATLVANKHDEESIRELVKLIEKNGWQEYL